MRSAPLPSTVNLAELSMVALCLKLSCVECDKAILKSMMRSLVHGVIFFDIAIIDSCLEFILIFLWLRDSHN